MNTGQRIIINTHTRERGEKRKERREKEREKAMNIFGLANSV